MRLFFAVNFDRATKANILSVQERLRRYGRGTFPGPENLHLTLAFLGEIEESRLPELQSILDNLQVPEMHLTFSHIGCFRNDSELWWIGLDDCPELARLQDDLSSSLRRQGFSLEKRKFRPHITIARRMNIGKMDSKKLLPRDFSTTVSHVSLMLSHRPNGVLTYTELMRK